MYGHHPAMNSGRFNPFSCQKLNNALLLRNRQILQYKHHLVQTRITVSIGRRFLSEPLLSPGHAGACVCSDPQWRLQSPL